MANPIILLTAALQTMQDHGTTLITINSGGTGFEYTTIDNLITAINGNAGQIAGGEDAINFTTIGGNNVSDFITRIRNELKAHNHTNKDVLDTITENSLNTWNGKQEALTFTPINSTLKGQANGYAPLNSETKITSAFLPDDYATKRTFVVVETTQERDDLPNIKETMLVLVNQAQVPDPDHPGQFLTQPVLYYCKTITPSPVWIPYVTINQTSATLQWDIIVGKPTSSVSDIDNMVTNSHTHTNNTVLNKLSESGDGKLLYNNEVIVVGGNGARKMSVFSQKVESLDSTFVLDSRFDPDKDTLWKVQYNGIKLIDTVDFTFEKTTKTITFLNEFMPSINRNLVITIYRKVA